MEGRVQLPTQAKVQGQPRIHARVVLDEVHQIGVAHPRKALVKGAEPRHEAATQVTEQHVGKTVAGVGLPRHLDQQGIARGIRAAEVQQAVAAQPIAVHVLIPADIRADLEAVPPAGQRQAIDILKGVRDVKERH